MASCWTGCANAQGARRDPLPARLPFVAVLPQGDDAARTHACAGPRVGLSLPGLAAIAGVGGRSRAATAGEPSAVIDGSDRLVARGLLRDLAGGAPRVPCR